MSAPDEKALEAVESLLASVVDALDLEADVTVETGEDGETIVGSLAGEDLGLFIGRHGQTIDAVQHLAHRAVVAIEDAPRHVVVDAAGYRARRQEALERQADEAAEEALRSDRDVALDAMTASERKLVHRHLAERGDVETASEGQEPERHLVVSPLRST